jgi:hypothetical protein
MNDTVPAIDGLDQLRGESSAAAIKAKIQYEELAADEDADRESWSAAWLHLWRAEEQQRQVFRAFERIDQPQAPPAK